MKKKLQRTKTNTAIFNVLEVFIVGLLITSIIILTKNIKLRNENETLETMLSEYTIVKKELDELTEIKKNYDIIEINNQTLEERKETLKAQINDLKTNINSLEEKIERLK